MNLTVRQWRQLKGEIAVSPAVGNTARSAACREIAEMIEGYPDHHRVSFVPTASTVASAEAALANVSSPAVSVVDVPPGGYHG